MPDDFSARLRGFGPLGVGAMLAIVLIGNFPVAPMAALLVLAWARLSQTPWRDLGLARPARLVRTIALGAVGGVVFKLLMKAIVMPLLGADPVNHAYHYLAGNRAALPGAIYLMVVGGGFGEELVYRGFLFERSAARFGRGSRARTITVIVTSLVFGLRHYPEQGLAGAEQAVITGMVFGSVYLATGTLWLSIVLHAVFDLTALAIIYLDLEPAVAHLFFR